MNKIYTILFLFSSNFCCLLGQIDEFVNHSDCIIKGKVIAQNTQYDQSLGRIFTISSIEILEYYKGNHEKKILSLVTEGGQHNELIQLSFHTASIATNDVGYFFLTEESDSFYLSHNEFGYVKLNQTKNPRIVFINKTFSDIEFRRQIYRSLSVAEKDLKNRHFSSPCNPSENSSFKMSISNLSLGENVEFDLTATALPIPSQFMGGYIEIEFPSEVGTNLITNNLLEITAGSLIDNNDFTLSIQNTTSTSIRIDISAVGSNGAFIIEETPLLHFSFDIANLNISALFNSNQIDVYGNVYYYCNGRILPYSKITFNSNGIGVSQGNSGLADIVYTFDNLSCNPEKTVFSFDIMAHSNNTSELLNYASAWVDFYFNPTGFFSDPITNSKGKVTKGDLIEQDNYLISVDNNQNNIYILITSFGTCDELSYLGETPVQVLHVELDIKNSSEDRGLYFDEQYMQDTPSLYCNPDVGEYDPLDASDENDANICECEDPEITEFSPEIIPAGMGEILTIEGNYFLSQDDESTIYFKNGDDGGITLTEVAFADIVSWENDEIQVIVPGTGKDFSNIFKDPPCSGYFEVHNRCGDTKSTDELEIPYCITNKREWASEKIAVKDDICIEFSSDIPPWARNAFKNELDNWCLNVNVNFSAKTVGNSSSTQAGIDNINLVSKGITSSSGGLAGLIIQSNTELYLNVCDFGGIVLKEVDFNISQNGLNLDIQDFRNVIRHEIGHAYMLNHSTNVGFSTPEESRPVMYYDATNLNFNNLIRNIKDVDKDGAMQLVSNSAEAIGNCGFSPLSWGGCNASCQTNSLFNDNYIYSIQAFPNPSVGHINIEAGDYNLKGSNFTIYTIGGKTIYKEKIEISISEFNVSIDLPSGIYVLEIISEHGYWANKITIE